MNDDLQAVSVTPYQNVDFVNTANIPLTGKLVAGNKGRTMTVSCSTHTWSNAGEFAFVTLTAVQVANLH